MVEASDFEIDLDRDSRNLRGSKKESKKRLNHKETQKRGSQIEKRNNQRHNTEKTQEEIKQEYNDVNEEYMRQLKKKKQIEEEAQKHQEKLKNFNEDLINLALGPEPNSERKKNIYQERLQKIKEEPTKKPKRNDSEQKAALLRFLKQSLD